MLVYTYVSSSGNESTFQWDQIQTPKWLFHFYLSSAHSLHFMICTVHFILLTHWAFCPNAFLDILEIFRLDIGQSSFNLVKKGSATWQRAFLPLASHFTTFWLGMRRNQNFETRNDLRLSRLSFLHFFSIFFRFFFFPFSYLFAAVIGLFRMGLLAVKKLLERVIEMANFSIEQPGVSGSKILLCIFHSTFWAFLCISIFVQILPWSSHM